MQPGHIFISHATKDDAFVAHLRQLLESFALTVWVDSRNLRGGNKLAPAINQAIEQARQTIVVISPNTVNSPWVRKEINYALEIEAQKQDAGYRVIPLLLPGIEPAALDLWFDEEPVGLKVQLTAANLMEGLMEALPAILAALGERAPDDPQAAEETAAIPVAELALKLSDAKVETADGKTRAQAMATLIYEPADGAPAIESKRFFFTAPLGPIETDDLRWYLEAYFRWPLGVFKERADRIEAQLPSWGQDLFTAALSSKAAEEALQAWLHAADKTERRFSVMVDSDLPEGAPAEAQASANEAASLLLSLPWELLHDGRGFLFHGKQPVRVRRRLPNRHPQKPAATNLPIRVLLVSPRPTDVGYIDHRISALPLVAAVEELGALVDLTILSPPTFPALQAALGQRQFDVIHFDGHGVYDPHIGLGALCFEDPQDCDKHQNIDAQQLAEVIREHRVPLVFLEACQSAQSELDPTTSVAASLLAEGVTSVVAMTHSVLVVTAQRFVAAFYRELARGARVGSAMLAGQQALANNDFRMQVLGAGALHLQDWFVPVLYQEKEDLRLVSRLPAAQVKLLQAQQRRRSFGKLLAEKERMQHEFVGRSRELLKFERLLAGTNPDWRQRYVVVRGRGGEGKTTLAVELAHWLTRTNRFDRAAFVSLEQYTDARGVLDEIGRQLLPEGEHWSVAHFGSVKEALQPVERALRDRRTILVIDNVESLLAEGAFVVPPSGGGLAPPNPPPEGGTTNALPDIFQLCRDLLDASGQTRLVFTSREALPEPFHHHHRTVELRELDHHDAIELVAEVMKRNGLEPKHDDAGNTPQEIAALIEAVGCHARALTLLARELAVTGVRATTASVQTVMAELERKHPGNRENSLYASVALSLRRLPPEMREQVKALAVFHGGANLMILGHVLGLDKDDDGEQRLAAALVAVGLAEAMDYGHLRLDPALPNYLLAQTDAAELAALTSRWAEAMRSLTGFLYQQSSQDAQLAAQLTLLELPNLLALLNHAADTLPPEEVVDLAYRVEALFARLSRPQALALAVRVRAAVAQRLGAWSHAQYLNADKNIDRLLEQGDFPAAYAAAQQLLARCQSTGADAYPGAAYDSAMAYFLLGRVLKRGGAAEEALAPLAEAQQRFQSLAEEGNASAANMASAAITERGSCLLYLGRYDKAAAAYEEGIRLDEKRGDHRGAAVGKAQLGTVRMLQKRYAEALESHAEARQTFAALGEPGSVATAWHQIGMVHLKAGQFDQAEQAYRHALALEVQQKNRAGEASSLGELGNLYGQMGRLEEAATFYRQAAEIYAQLQDLRYEGLVRNNLADTLIKLQRYDEARPELLRALECKQTFGHAATIWNAWAILHDLEQATGHAQAAAEARGQAVAAYLAYRRAGGESQANTAPLYALVAQALQDGTPDALTAAAAQLTALSQADIPAWGLALLDKLQAVLRGDRDPALAADPALDYGSAVELQLLQERLSTPAASP
jgi:tetratricopeptide (TPR) repeat protein